MPSSDRVDIQLRCQWQSPQPTLWDVGISLTHPRVADGTISEWRNATDSPTTTGAWDLSHDQRDLRFQPRHKISAGAVEFRVRAPALSKLRLDVQATATKEKPDSIEISLADLISGKTIESKPAADGDDSKPTWSITRVAGDSLRIEHAGDLPIVTTASKLDFTIKANGLVNHAASTKTLRYSLYQMSSGHSVLSGRRTIQVDAFGNGTPAVIDDVAPSTPGVYELQCELEPDGDKLWSRLRRREAPVAQSSQTLIVLESGGAIREDDTSERTAWRTIGEIRPSESSWSVGEWMPKQATRLVPGVRHVSGDLPTDQYANEMISLISPESVFQATLPVLSSGDPHQISLRFPAKRMSRVRVDVATGDDEGGSAVSFVLNRDSFANEDATWKTHTFVYYPSGNDQISLTNLDPSSPAGFESIRVQAGPSRLIPSNVSIPNQRDVALRLPTIHWVDALSDDVLRRDAISNCNPRSVALYRTWVATERLRDYVIAAGMNSIVVPSSGVSRAWFDAGDLIAATDPLGIDQDRLRILLRMMEPHRLRVFVSLRPSMNLSPVEMAIRETPSLLGELVTGEASATTDHAHYNAQHPLVQTPLVSLFRNLYSQCRSSSAFAGIVLQCDQTSHLHGVGKSWDEVDPSSRVLLNSMIKEIPLGQPILVQMESAHSDKVPVNSIGERKTRSTENPPIDPKNWVFVRGFRQASHERLSKRFLFQQQLMSVDPLVAKVPTAALVGDESSTNSLVTIRSDQHIDVCRIIDRLDPPLLIVDLPVSTASLLPDLASVLRQFASTPLEQSRSVAPTDQNIETMRVRTSAADGHAYVSMVSLAPWTSEVELESQAGTEWELVDQPDLPQFSPATSPAAKILPSSGGRTRVLVPAGQVMVLKSKAPVGGQSIHSWTAAISGGQAAAEKVKQQVTWIVERIGTLADPQPYTELNNGGFEQTGGTGLAGWLHAQHPPKCVRIDEAECMEGEHAVLMTTDATVSTRTWMVSETIQPPLSGRLAVSMACRAEMKGDHSTHRLRVSIETTQNGIPMRHSTEFGVLRNGQWKSREIVLEADGIDPQQTDSLRVTIDSLSGGRVWIDDVRLHDQFPMARERVQLQSQAFLAVQGLQRGNLTPSARLLQNHWARSLLDDFSSHSQPVIHVQASEQAPGVAERVRSWLPRPLRF